MLARPKRRGREALDFAAKLCLALGHGSLAETLGLSAAEFAFWADHYRRHGFPADRLEAGVAISGAAVCRSNGRKVDPPDLLPRFGGRGAREVAAAFAGIPGAKVVRVPRAAGV